MLLRPKLLVAIGCTLVLGCQPLHFVVDAPDAAGEPDVQPSTARYVGAIELVVQRDGLQTSTCVGQATLDTLADGGAVVGKVSCAVQGELAAELPQLELELDGLYGRGTSLYGAVRNSAWAGTHHFDGRLRDDHVELSFEGAVAGQSSCEGPITYSGGLRLPLQ